MRLPGSVRYCLDAGIARHIGSNPVRVLHRTRTLGISLPRVGRPCGDGHGQAASVGQRLQGLRQCPGSAARAWGWVYVQAPGVSVRNLDQPPTAGSVQESLLSPVIPSVPSLRFARLGTCRKIFWVFFFGSPAIFAVFSLDASQLFSYSASE